MGRPPTHGAPSFRFSPAEVAQMETILRDHAGQVPSREFLVALANQFSNSTERAGKSIVQMKQVWNWFQNRRYALRSKVVKSPGSPNLPPNPQGEATPVRNVPQVHQQAHVPSGHNSERNASENPPLEFEAKSARDGAWYDVQTFLSQRNFDTPNPEVLVRFSGFGQEEDEWVNVYKHVRHRSLPCESSECCVVTPGDLILCFQEGKEQALYFDAHVLDAQRRRHDLRGCRCRFLVRYDHDQSEEIVPLRKVCRRPETDYRLLLLHSTNESTSASSSVIADSKRAAVDPVSSSSLRVPNPSPGPVSFPSHTIVNPTNTAQHPALIPATASGSTSAPSLNPTPIPTQSLTSASAQAPAMVLAPTPAPDQAQAPSLAPVQAQAPALVLAATPQQASALKQTPALTTDGTPASASGTTPDLTAISVQTPSVTPMSAPIPPPIPVSSPTQSSIAIPASDPSLTVISSSPQILGHTPTMISTPSPTPVTSSAGEASTRESITNPSAGSTIMEVKKEEIGILGTSTLRGGTNENPALTVFSPEKVENITAPSEPTEVNTAPVEGGPSVSTVPDSSNVLGVSTDDTNEGKAENR